MRILIVEDHPLYANATRAEIGTVLPDAHIDLAQSLEQAVRRAQDDPAYDYVLLDLNIPGAQGLSGLRALRQAMPDGRVAILSGEDDPLVMRAAFEEGAVGFVPKSLSTEDFVAALRALLQGGFYFPPDAFAKSEQSPARMPFSPREMEVLAQLARGAPNKDIARTLTVSQSTVKHHVSAIFRKLEVASRSEAIVKAARLGLVERG
jgi:DNA-binding NarL/FixJ family response regulator